MDNNKEHEILIKACEGNNNLTALIEDLLDIQKSKSLLKRQRGRNDEYNAKIEAYLKKERK